MISLFNLEAMNNDWDSHTLVAVHAYEDWDNDKILYRGEWRDMPIKFGNLMVRAFGTADLCIYIELEPGEEKKL